MKEKQRIIEEDGETLPPTSQIHTRVATDDQNQVQSIVEYCRTLRQRSLDFRYFYGLRSLLRSRASEQSAWRGFCYLTSVENSERS